MKPNAETNGLLTQAQVAAAVGVTVRAWRDRHQWWVPDEEIVYIGRSPRFTPAGLRVVIDRLKLEAAEAARSRDRAAARRKARGKLRWRQQQYRRLRAAMTL